MIAEAWDATFVLFDGLPTPQDIARLAANVPRQEAGRYLATELVLARANRSVRLFDHVLDALAEGRQPDEASVEAVGYLMRTTAVYGNGKFGIADRDKIKDRPELSAPFRAEMLTVYLIRLFTLDLVEHLARLRGGAKAVTLDRHLRRRFGIGNATGLGMAPFLVKHPALLDRWITARETALARVRELRHAERKNRRRIFAPRSQSSRRRVAAWTTSDEIQARRIRELVEDLVEARSLRDRARLRGAPALGGDLALRARKSHARRPGIYGHASHRASCRSRRRSRRHHDDRRDDELPHRRKDELRGARGARSSAITPGRSSSIFRKSRSSARFWYVSEEKLEPRLGERFEEPGMEREQPLAIAREVAALAAALDAGGGPHKRRGISSRPSRAPPCRAPHPDRPDAIPIRRSATISSRRG